MCSLQQFSLHYISLTLSLFFPQTNFGINRITNRYFSSSFVLIPPLLTERASIKFDQFPSSFFPLLGYRLTCADHEAASKLSCRRFGATSGLCRVQPQSNVRKAEAEAEAKAREASGKLDSVVVVIISSPMVCGGS